MRRLVPLSSLVLLLLAAPASAQRDFSGVEMKLTHVAGSVYLLEGEGGNIGVSVGEDGVLLVDDQFAPLAPKIRAAIETLSEDGVAFVLNTHWHGDHVGGNEVFGREATIVAHENVRKRMATDQVQPRGTTPARPKEALPVITFGSSLSLHFNGEEIRAIHLPRGHTDGDSVIHFTGSNVVHLGDHMFAGLFPFVDLDSGGSVDGYVENVAQVLAKLPEGARIIPGHGPLATAADLRTFHRMLVETREIVRARLAEGRSLDAILEAGLGEEWASWSWRFIDEERWIRTLHRDLTRRD